MPRKEYDIVFLVESGIGNALQMLYAVEHCIFNNIRVGIYLHSIAKSFTDYVKDSYGPEIVLDNVDNIHTANLVQSFTFTGRVNIEFENYFYVYADKASSVFQSETEQCLSIVHALYPSSYSSKTLQLLKEDVSKRVLNLKVSEKYILFPGCSSEFPIKRWPYFQELITRLGSENIIVLGGNDDLVFKYSYYYPKWITSIMPRKILRRRTCFNLLKRFGLMKKHAHLNEIKGQPYSYFNVFSWPELVAILRNAKMFIGNDGGISHLAGVCGTKGLMIFGPSSVDKNKAFNDNIIPVSTQLGCQPCQFKVNNADFMSSYSILCPRQLACLYSITADNIAERLSDVIKEETTVKKLVRK